MNINDGEAKGNIPIFLLKTKSTPHDGYAEKFSAITSGLRFAPLFVPVLEHQLLDKGLDVVKNLLQSKDIGTSTNNQYGGMIFTSQRAVEAFAKLVDTGKDKGDESWPYLQGVPIYTVGPATSRALRSISQDPPLNIFGADMGNGEALAHYMLDHYGRWYQDRETKPPLLFLVGEQRRDIIPKTLMNLELPSSSRIQVDELEVYGTGVMESFEEDFFRVLEETRDVRPRWVVVFSPTGCKAMLRALNMLDLRTGKVKKDFQREDTFIATIGPTTRDFLKNDFGYEPDVCAEKPSPEGIEEGIKNFMAHRS